MPSACPGDGYDGCYNNGPSRSSFPLNDGLAAPLSGKEDEGSGSLLRVATNVRLPGQAGGIRRVWSVTRNSP
jgi:hypothetical protein